MSSEIFLCSLLSYNPELRLRQLIRDEDYEDEKIKQMRTFGLFASGWKLSSQSDNTLSTTESKVLRKKIALLRDDLTSEFIQAVEDKDKLSKLYTKVYAIHEKRILPNLENSINNSGVNKKQKILDSLSKLNEVVLAIVSKHMTHNKNVLFYPSTHNGPLLPSSSPEIAARYTYSLEYLQAQQARQRLEIVTNSGFLAGLPPQTRITAITSTLLLDKKEDYIQAIQNFTTDQILKLLNEIEKCSSYHAKAAYVFAGIPYAVLEEIMYCADEAMIDRWRVLLEASSPIEKTSALLGIQGKCIERTNSTGNEIDEINKRFRTYTKSCQLRSEDIQQLDSLELTIKLRSDATYNLAQLLKDIKKSEKDHVFKELMALYHHFSLRISNNEEVYTCTKNVQALDELIRLNTTILQKHDNDPQTKEILKMTLEYLKKSLNTESSNSLVEGCPYGILYRNFVLDEDLTVSCTAIEILGTWCIYSRDEYVQFRLIKEDEGLHIGSGALNKYISNKLADNGIKEIKDWFRIKVFNGEMLKSYLEQIFA